MEEAEAEAEAEAEGPDGPGAAAVAPAADPARGVYLQLSTMPTIRHEPNHGRPLAAHISARTLDWLTR